MQPPFKRETIKPTNPTCCCGSCCVPRYPTTHPFPQTALLENTAMSLLSGSRPLASAIPSRLDPHLDPSQTSCWWPVSWRSLRLGLQNWPHHVFQQLVNVVVVGVDKPWAPNHWIWAWVEGKLVSPPALLRLSHQCQLYCFLGMVKSCLPSATASKHQSQFFCTCATRANSPMLPRQGVLECEGQWRAGPA